MQVFVLKIYMYISTTVLMFSHILIFLFYLHKDYKYKETFR